VQVDAPGHPGSYEPCSGLHRNAEKRRAKRKGTLRGQAVWKRHEIEVSGRIPR
jgi:hypothetical protein